MNRSCCPLPEPCGLGSAPLYPCRGRASSDRPGFSPAGTGRDRMGPAISPPGPCRLRLAPNFPAGAGRVWIGPAFSLPGPGRLRSAPPPPPLGPGGFGSFPCFPCQCHASSDQPCRPLHGGRAGFDRSRFSSAGAMQARVSSAFPLPGPGGLGSVPLFPSRGQTGLTRSRFSPAARALSTCCSWAGLDRSRFFPARAVQTRISHAFPLPGTGELESVPLFPCRNVQAQIGPPFPLLGPAGLGSVPLSPARAGRV